MAQIFSFYNRIRGWIYNKINPIGYARSMGVKIGERCRLITVNFGSEPYLVTLGDHVSATLTTFVTHDGGVWVFRDKEPDIDVVAPIKVGNNVFLGAKVIVLPGVNIGDNVVIGAGAIVTRDIPSNCVAVGIPAKPIKSLAEYKKTIDTHVIHIKTWSGDEKKKFLLKHFGLENYSSLSLVSNESEK